MQKLLVFLLFVFVIEVAFGQDDTSDLAIRQFFKDIGTYHFTNPIGRRQLKTYYATRNVQLSWANAFSFCKANGMNLVELHSEQEVNQFLTMCSDNSLDYFLHVGGSAEGMTDRLDFYWMTTGERISYSLKYHPAGKNNAGGKERCLSVAKQPNKYTFNDVDCWQHFIWSFVCQQVKDI